MRIDDGSGTGIVLKEWIELLVNPVWVMPSGDQKLFAHSTEKLRMPMPPVGVSEISNAWIVCPAVLGERS